MCAVFYAIRFIMCTLRFDLREILVVGECWLCSDLLEALEGQ